MADRLAQESRSPSVDVDAKNQPGSDTSGYDSAPVTEKAAVPNDIYSVYGTKAKRAIVMSASIASFFSPFTGSVYFPALNNIASDLHTTIGNVNLTVTAYLIFQGLAPTIVAGFSDTAGRRPAYMICFVLYTAANLGLALQNNYVALLILRMLQSSGSSGTVALGNAIVADVVSSTERGIYMAWAQLGALFGPSVGPIIGGIIAQYAGWKWIFWMLLILSSAFFIPFLLFLPETCRNVVGDGSIPPPSKFNMSLIDYRKYRRIQKQGSAAERARLDHAQQNYRIRFPNPLRSLKVAADLESALVLLSLGIQMACFYAIQTGAPLLFSQVYGFDSLKIGLVFLPLGGGVFASAFTTGWAMDWNYRRHARRLGFPLTHNRATDLRAFPLERARLQVILPLMFLGVATVAAYGWLLRARAPLPAPLIVLFALGWAQNAGMQALTVLLIDLHPTCPAAAAAANNLFRCLLGAGASALVDPLLNAVGAGWTYTVAAGVWLLFTPALVAVMIWGPAMRRRRAERQEAKEAAAMERAMAERRISGGDGNGGTEGQGDEGEDGGKR